MVITLHKKPNVNLQNKTAMLTNMLTTQYFSQIRGEYKKLAVS